MIVSESKHRLGGSRVLHGFDNGYGASVLCGDLFYSKGVDTYELAVMKLNPTSGKYGLCYNTPITDDVLGYLTADEVEEYLRQIEDLPHDNA